LSLQTTLSFVAKAEIQRQLLKETIQYFKSLQKSDAWGASQTAIQTFFVPGNEAVRAVAKHVQEAGFAVKPIVYPTVPKGKERIRITLTAKTSHADLRTLINTLETHA
jgi:8-amino-7-oxononanoate synthase